MERNVPAERVQAYSDAFFSIIATLMVIPLAHLEEDDVTAFKACQEDAEDCHEWHQSMVEKAEGVGVFVPTFYLVAVVWRYHATLMYGLETIKGSAVTMTLFHLFAAVAFLPITARLQVGWSSDPLSTLIFIGNTGIVVVHTMIIKYIVGGSGKEIALSMTMFGVCMLVGIVVAYAWKASLGVYFYYGAIVLCYRMWGLCTSSSNPQKPAASTTGKLVKLLLPHIATAKKKRLFGRARLEAFTDGVHAIVATLIILDIKSPIDAGPQPLPLTSFLRDNAGLAIAAVATLMVVGMQWSNHHALLRLVHDAETASSLQTPNVFMCILLSLLPFSMSVLVDLSVPWYGLLLLGAILCVISWGYMFCLWLFVKKTPPRPAHFAELSPMGGHAGARAHGGGTPPAMSPSGRSGGGGGEERGPASTPVRDSHIRALLKLRLTLQSMCGVGGLIAAACQAQSHWWPGAWCTALAVLVLGSGPLYRGVYFLPRWFGALPGPLEALESEGEEGEGSPA